MATYLQGLTDYIPQIQPFRPDFNFYAYALQTKQSQYEANYEKLSSIYGTLLNSPMLRDVNNKRRDDFFKAAETNIQKMSGIDLSLQENVDAAYNVFKPFYEDKNMMKDISWTRQYQKELQRADNFRNCVDPKKCGGKYWDTGVTALHYRADEFRNASDEQALGFSNPRFSPYIDVMEKAMNLAKEAGLNIKKDVVSGQWIYTMKNGQQVVGPLYSLFAGSLGSDPAIQEMYQTQAYVERKNFAKTNAMVYGSEDAAEANYINTILSGARGTFAESQRQNQQQMDEMLQRKNDLERKEQNTGLTLAEQYAYQNTVEGLQGAQTAADQYETMNNALSNGLDGIDINVLRSRADMARAGLFMHNDLMNAAEIMSHRDEELTMKENPYAMASFQADLSLRNSMKMADVNFQNDVALKQMDYKFKMLEKQMELQGGEKEVTQHRGAPWASSDQNLAENPKAVFNENAQVHQEKINEAKGGMINFITDAYNLAKNAQNRPGAQKMLNLTFNGLEIKSKKGGWMGDILDKTGSKKIKSWKEFTPEMLNNMSMSELTNVYNKARDLMDQSKCSSCDREWASEFLADENRVGQMQDIDLARQAEYAIAQHRVNLHKDVVKGIQADDGYKFYKDADLFLSAGGTNISSKEAFIEAFKKRHAGDNEYTPKLRKGTTERDAFGSLPGGGDYYAPDRNIVSDAEEAYNAIDEKFFIDFNNKKGSSIQGIGVLGGYGGGKFTEPTRISGLDAREYMNDWNIATKSVLKDVTSNIPSGEWYTTVGEPTSDSYPNEDLKSFVNTLYSDLNQRYAKDQKDRPMFDVEYSNIAVNDPKKSAISFYFSNPEYTKKYVGTKNNPGPLWDYRDQLDGGKPLTIVFDNTKAQNAFHQKSQASDLDYIISLSPDGLKYDQYKDAGEISIKTDGMNYKVDGHYYMYEQGVRKTYPFVQTWPKTTDVNWINQQIKNDLSSIQMQNRYIEQQLARLNKQQATTQTRLDIPNQPQ